MRAAFAAVEPGMRDRDIAAIAQCYSQRHGSENGIYLCASMPPGKPAQFGQRHYQNRVIQEGDAIALLVEDAGPAACTQSSAAPASSVRRRSELKDEFAFALEARKFNLDLLKPGAPCKESSPPITNSCAATAGPRRSGCTATARATTWSSGR